MFRMTLRLRVTPAHMADIAAEFPTEPREFVEELARELGRAQTPADRMRLLDTATAALTELLAAAYGAGLSGSLD